MKPIYPESEFYLKSQIFFQDHYIKVQIHRTSKTNIFQDQYIPDVLEHGDYVNAK
jgi:hypothetical protein